MKSANQQGKVMQKKQEWNYQLIDVMKYLAAIMVICVHCNQLFPQDYLNFFIKNILCRIAVPFFFISSAYFVRKGSKTNDNYVKTYLKNLIISYCFWSIIFIPIGLDWIHQNLDLSGYLLPFALLYGLVHIGTYYHLWYVPAMILAIFFVHKLLKRYSYKALFTLSIALFLFGSMESYYGLLPPGWFKDFFDILIKVIFTTRSGIFYGIIFTLIGFFLYDHQDNIISLSKYLSILTLLSFILLIIEGTFLYGIERLDMNFMIMLIPFSFFFFQWILVCPITFKFHTKKLRELSKYYYFIHPVCIVIVEEIGQGLGLPLLSSGIISLLLIILLTQMVSSLIIKTKHPLNKPFVLLSPLLGMLVTMLLASIFFSFKLDEIMIKFELVPCLWFYSSFLIYGILSRIRIDKKPIMQ
ncbi:acyltransferase family protein [[Eubacterium] hominis]|uniref:acyltransferase family protein n=1 Tax=[Eubacterium] hominis TaxID=2764325 RepID=UPI003A4E579D